MYTQLNMFEFDNPTMQTLDIARCYTRPVNSETANNIFVEYHYAHRPCSISLAVGMYVDNVLAGVIGFGTTPSRNCHGAFGEEYIPNGLALNRLYIFDWAGRNSESWLVGQGIKWLNRTHPEIYHLVSYADPLFGHVGTIYQATNWIYTGTGSAQHEVLVNGKRYHQKSLWDIWGTCSQERLRTEFGLDVEFIKTLGKHRYVKIIGNKTIQKRLRPLLRWPVHPYPKLIEG